MPTTRRQLKERKSIATKNFNILIGVTGSVAAIKLVELVKKLNSVFPKSIRIGPSNNVPCNATISVKIVMTESAKHFIDLSALKKGINDPKIEIYDDSDEWDSWEKVGDEVLHIELRKWANLCLLAPLGANTMAKIVHGFCDNLLTCVIRAWDSSKPLIYCPAMNVLMWDNPITAEQLCKLQSRGYLRVGPVEKRLACGDVGMGGLAPVESIVEKIVEILLQPDPGKSTCLPKTLVLNQPPTYPIMSVSNTDTDRNKPTSKLPQIVEKLKTNNKPPTYAISTPSEPPARKNLRTYSAYSADKLHVKLRNQNCTAPPQPSAEKSNAVTSLQNLKAIDLDQNTNADADNQIDEFVSDELDCDLDPTRLLEQTLTTDDCLTSEQETKSAANTHIANTGSRMSSTESKPQPPPADFVSPLFNTTKFLTLCHNPTKNCFTCVICKNDYKNRKSMARHLKEQHVQGNIFSCIPCGVSYKRREKLIKHNREHHTNGHHQTRTR